MQLLNLTGLGLLLILLSYSKGENFTVTVQGSISAASGGSVIIPCTFTYPPGHTVRGVFWKTNGQSDCSKNDNDKRAFASHLDPSCVDSKYRQKTRLIGEVQDGNCTLEIKNIQVNDRIYLRVVTNKDKFSFIKKQVSINLNAQNVAPDLTGTEDFTSLAPTVFTENSQENNFILLTIIVPVVLLLIGAVVGIVVYVKHSRKRSLTREESGYYVNFRRDSSKPPKSEAPSKTLDVKPSEEKVLDDPVYINVQAQTNQTGHNVDQTDSIYANMDYSE